MTIHFLFLLYVGIFLTGLNNQIHFSKAKQSQIKFCSLPALRKAKKSLDVIELTESLPYGTDTAETQLAPELSEDAMTRFLNSEPSPEALQCDDADVVP